MAEFAANFLLNNDSINTEFNLSEGAQFDALFEIYASGTVWGSISGTLSNQTDLQAALNLKADKTELYTAIQNEATTRAENDTLLQNNINTLSQTVTANYNTLDGKIDTEISNRTAADTTLQNNIDAEALARQNADTVLQNNINTLSQTVTDNNTAINDRVDGVVSAFDDEIETINTNLSDLSDTVSDNYTDLDDKISDLTDTVNDNDTAINNKVDGINTTLTNSINSLSNTVTNNYNSLDARITTNTDNIATNAGNITTINSKIPNQASSSNQLADKDFVNSSIATNTANFIGTFNSVAELEAYTGTLTNNDYAFVATTDTAGNTLYDRYKYNADTQEWLFEYELNNSSFTAQQWASINSGATSTNIGQITTNANNIADLQTNKQDVLTAGANVQINNNVISATDTTYTAGTGISIVNGVISNTQTSAEWGNIQGTLSNQTDLQNALDAKQNTISDLSTIRSGASAGATALQPNDNISELTNDVGYITSASLPIVNNGTLDIQVNGTSVGTFTANQSGNTTANIVVPDSATWGNITGTLSNQTDLQNALDAKQNTISDLSTIRSGASAGATALQPNDNISELTNDVGYITSASLPIVNNGTLDIQVNGTSVGTFTANQSGNSTVNIEADTVLTDDITVSKNSDDELQAIGVIDDNSGNAIKTWTGTKAEYDAIVTKDATTLYNIVDDTDTTLTLLELLFPVGAVYFGTMSTCPLQTLGVGTWQALPPDKVIQIAGTRGNVGDMIDESLPNIWYSNGGLTSDPTIDGALTSSAKWNVQQNESVSSTRYIESYSFSASNCSSTYQNNAPVQQDAYLLNGWRRIA